MNQLTVEFFKHSRIPQNNDTVGIMGFLTSAESINKMTVMSDLGYTALAGVVKELEDKFGDCQLFPISSSEAEAASNRRNIGRMMKFIMKAYGYTPIKRENGDKQRVRVGGFTGSKYFTTATKYEKTKTNTQYEITITSIRCK